MRREPSFRMLLILLASATVLSVISLGCSLHYSQGVDGQTLDVEVLHRVRVSRTPEK